MIILVWTAALLVIIVLVLYKSSGCGFNHDGPCFGNHPGDLTALDESDWRNNAYKAPEQIDGIESDEDARIERALQESKRLYPDG